MKSKSAADELPDPHSTVDSATEACLFRLREAAALLFWRHDAIQVSAGEPFRLASGNSSPIYVNCRRLISEPTFMDLYVTAARLLLERATPPGVIAGGETAGIPFAGWLAQALSKPLVYVRKKAKGYGLAARVEGRVEPGAVALLVEDLITDGGSKVGFIEALGAAGATVSDALVVFDRQQGGAALLAEHGLRLHAVTARAPALALGEEIGRLDAAARRGVDDYFRDPAAWHRERDLPYSAGA